MHIQINKANAPASVKFYVLRQDIKALNYIHLNIAGLATDLSMHMMKLEEVTVM